MAGDILVTFEANLGGNALAKLEEIKAQLDALVKGTHEIKVNVNGKDVIKQLNNIASGKTGGKISGGKNGIASGITKSLSANLKTQKSQIEGMISSLQKSYGKLLSNPLKDSASNQKLLKGYNQQIANLQRALNVVGGGREIGPKTMQGYQKGVIAYSNRVKAAYAEEAMAAKEAAAVEKAAAKETVAAHEKATKQIEKSQVKRRGATSGKSESGTKSGLTGAIKLQTAELQTQKQLLNEMMSTVTGARRTIRNSPLLSTSQKADELGRLKLLMDDINRYQNATKTLGYNSPKAMQDITRQVDGVRQRVAALKEEEAASKRMAAAEKDRAAAMNKTWSNAAASKQKAITNQVADAAKQLANYQSRYQSLLNSTYGGTAQGGRSLNELKEWMNFGQSLFKNAQRATPFNVKGTGALRDLTGVLGELSSMYSAVEARAKSFAAAERAANSRWASAETAKQKSIASQLAASMKGISNAEKLYQKLSNSPMAGNKSLQDFGQQIAQVKQMAEAAGKIKLYDPQGATKLNQLASAVTGLGASYANIKAKADAFTKSQRAALSESKAFTRQAGSMQKRIETFMGKNPRLAGTTYEQQLQNLIGGMQAKSKTGTGTLNNLRAVEQQFNSIKKAAADAGKTGQTFGQSIVGAVKQFGGWMLITHSIMKTIQTIKNMIGTVRDLDTAMTELRRVTHETSDTYDQFYQGATKRAVDIGATLKDTIQASADFVKLGYDIHDAPGLADAALVYKNVGIGIEDISDASNSIISAMKAFQLGPEEAMSVVDKFNLVGNNFAISSAGIGEAIERSASAMASAGNTLDETIALITAGNEVVQDPQKMGTTLKTLSMYLRASKTEAEDAGIETDGMAESVSKLRDELMSLTGGKVDIMLDDDTFKSTYQILKELSQVWDDLTDINRANILEKIGGKRNANVSAAIITNFAQAEKALATSMNSAGSAMKENEKYLDSIEGRTAKFRATWQALSGNFFSTDFIKGVVSGTTAVASGFDGLIKKIGAIPTLMATITAAMSAFRLRQTGRTGIFDVVTNPKGPPSIRLFNSELKSLGGTIKDVYGTYYRQAGGGVKGAVASGIKSPFALMSASILGRGGQIREYNQLAKAYKDAQKAYQPHKGKTGAVAEAQRQNFKNAANSLAAYNTQLKASSSLWAQYANSVNKTATSTNATFAGFTKWLAQNNKMGQAFFGTFTKGLAGVASMFGSAFVSAGISMAVMGVISLITQLAQRSENLRKQTADSALAFSQSKESLQGYAAEISQINTSLEGGSLSIEETVSARQRLLAIQGELQSSYGAEASGLNLISMGATEAAAAIDRLAEAEAKRYLEENKKGIEQAEEEMSKSRYDSRAFELAGDEKYNKQLKQNLQELASEFDSIDILSGNGMSTTPQITFEIDADVNAAIEELNGFKSRAQELDIDLNKIVSTNIVGEKSTLNEYITELIGKYQNIVDKYGQQDIEAMKATIDKTKEYRDIQNSITDAQEEYNNALAKSYGSDTERAETVRSAITGLQDIQKAIDTTEFKPGDERVKNYIQDMYDTVLDGLGQEEFDADLKLNVNSDALNEAISDYKRDMKEFSEQGVDKDGSLPKSIDNIKTSFDDLSKDAPDKMKNLLDAVKQFQSDSGEIKVSDILDGQKTNAAGWERLSAAAKDYSVSVEFALQKLADAHVIQSDTTDLAYNANEQFKDLFATTNGLVESQQLLNSVYSEQSQKGTLSLKTYEALVKEHKEFGGMLEAEGSSIRFNAEAAQELIDAQAKENAIALQQKKIDALTRYKQNKDAIDELEKSTKRLTETEQKARDAKIARLKAENEDIEANVAKVSIQIAQLDSLTSAYSKWQVAQQTANQDTMYNDMLSAKKQIEEGLKNGMIGTDDFKTAVRMLIPDAPDPSDYKAINSYMQKLNRYLTTDSEGNVTRTGMQNFLTDAVNNGLMELEDGYYKVLDGISPEDFVDKMTITPSMAQAIFANLEAHGYEFDWTAEDFFHLENVEEAKNKINEVKEAFNEIDQNTDYSTEGRAKAIADLANSEKENVQGIVDSYQQAINEMNLFDPGTKSFQDAHDRAEDLMNVIKELPPEILLELGFDTDKLDDLLDPERMADPIEVQADVADAESNIEQVGETYNTTKDGIESNPITTPAPQTEPFDARIDGVESRVGTVKDLVEGTPMKLPTPYADSFNDGITQEENRFLSMKDLVESTPIKLPTPGGQSTETSDNPEITVDSNIEPFDAGITQAETRFYSTKELIEGSPININQGEPPEIPEPQELPPIELPVDTSTAEQKIQSVRELMNLPMEMPAPNTGAAEGAIGKLEQRVAEIKKTLGSGEATNADAKITVDADTTAAKAKIVALGDTPVKVPIEADPSGIQNAVKSGVDGAIKVDVDANVAQAKQQIAQLNQMELTVNIKANLVNAQQTINGLNGGGTAQDINVAVNYNPNTGSLPESFPDISRMVNYIAQLAALPSTLPPITRMVNYVPSGVPQVNGTANASGTAHANGTAYASGNWGAAPGGTALVAELGPELIVNPDTGRWYTVGDHGAQFADIPKGAIVFNHKQTEALFKYGKVAGRGKALANGTAFAEGTALAGGPAWTIFGTNGSTSSSSGNKSKNKSTSTNKPKSNKSSKGKSNVAATATAEIEVDLRLSDKDLEEKLKDELSKMSENLEYILGQYEHEIFLIEKGAINGFTEEDVNNVISIYKKMMDEVHSQADAARAKGLSDNSKTVRELSEKWYELRDSIKDTINDYYESLISKTGNAIKQLEFQMDRLQGRSRKLSANPQSNYDAILKQADQIVEKQREIQRLAHEGAEEMRSLGFDDVSEEVTKYKDEWADADEAIVEAITSAYDAIDKDLENRTTLTENWLDKAITDTDFDKVIKYSDDIYNYYTQRQNAIHDEAERLRALGYADTSEEVSKLSDLWWDYEEKRKAMAIDAWKEIIDATKEAASTISGVYENLQKAADEYAKFGGYISLDTMESLLEMGPEYLRFLQDENGLLAINRDSIQQVIAAKYEDLAVTNALSYVDRLRLAIEGKSNETLDEVLGTTNDLTGATWGLVYAKLADLNMTEDQMAIAEENIKRMQALSQNAIEGIGMTLFGDADRYADSMNDLIKYVMDMLADRLDEQIDKIKEQEDEYSKLIDKKKESLRVTKEENEYHKTIADKMKEAARLQEKIDLLALDDSRQGQAERLKLQEDMQKLQDEISESQADHLYEAQTDALDKIEDAFKEEKDEEIKKLEETASSYQKRWDQAIDYIRTHYGTLYNELIDWNYKMGDSLSTDIENAWKNAEEAVKHYGSIAEAVMAAVNAKAEGGVNSIVGKSLTGDETAQIGKSSQSDSALISNIASTIQSMKANSRAYDAEGPNSIANGTSNQKDLAAKNVELAAILSRQLGVSLTRNKNGEWVLPDGKKLYDISTAEIRKIIGVYHQGGRVGRGTVAENEKIALLKDKEWVLSEKMVQNLSAQMDRIRMLKDHAFGTLAPAGGPPLLAGMDTMSASAYGNITNNKPVTITFGDTVIYGENGNTVAQHQKVNEDMVNQIARMLGVRR